MSPDCRAVVEGLLDRNCRTRLDIPKLRETEWWQRQSMRSSSTTALDALEALADDIVVEPESTLPQTGKSAES